MRTTQRRQASTASGMRRPFVGRSDATGQQKYLNIIIMRYSLLARRRQNPIIRGAPYVFHSPSVMTRGAIVHECAQNELAMQLFTDH